MCIYTHTYTYVYIHIHTYIHTYIHRSTGLSLGAQSFGNLFGQTEPPKPAPKSKGGTESQKNVSSANLSTNSVGAPAGNNVHSVADLNSSSNVSSGNLDKYGKLAAVYVCMHRMCVGTFYCMYACMEFVLAHFAWVCIARK